MASFQGIRLPSLINRKNWKVVLLCFLGAATFWFFNALNKSYTARINQPISFLYNPEGLITVGNLPGQIEVDVTGMGWNLLRKTVSFNPEPVTISLDNPVSTQFILGSSLRPLLSDELPELTVNYVITDTLHLQIEPEEQKVLRVSVDSLALDIEESFRITSPISVGSDTVQVIGPKSIIDTLAEEYVIRVGQQGIDEDFDRDMALRELPRYVTVNPERINVNFNVRPYEQRETYVSLNPSGFPEDVLVRFEPGILKLFYWVEEDVEREPVDSLIVVELPFEEINPADSTVVPRIASIPDWMEDPALDSILVKVVYE